MQSFWMRRPKSVAALALISLGLLCWAVTLFLLLQGDNSRSADAILDEASQVVVKREESAGVRNRGHSDDGDKDKLLRPLVEQEPHGRKQEPHGRVSYLRLEGVDAAGNDLFLVHGADLHTLKSVCSSLDICVGFNSEGWMKGRIVEKKRSELDLYVKQSISRSRAGRHQTTRNATIVDEAAGVFADHMTEYRDMERSMKLYMYETDVGQHYPSYKDYKYGVEDLFRELLAKSRFRTQDPAEADFFFIPSRCTAYRKSVRNLQQGIDRAAQIHRQMVDEIQHGYPFWNQSLGTDHFYICAHDMGTEVVKYSVPEAWKNSIGLVNTAEYSEQYFIPHKDISVPPHPGRDAVDWPVIGQGGLNSDPLKRTYLAFMAGNANRGVRPSIYEIYGKDRSFNLVKGQLKNQEYFKGLLTSKFCLCPRGNKGWSPRVMDALWFGCVPVFLADHYHPPLADLIPWQDISLRIPETQIGSLRSILEGVSEQRLVDMQHKIAQVYRHLTWHDPPRPYDAFYGIIFQLWQRRHIHRTKPLLTDCWLNMEGTLWKWTNYLSGWQPRWFVLEGGCLSYYLSPGEVHLGSRGALKVSSCDITVHASDHQRMDMVMPGGRHIYLRAASMSERQQWLLALGVAKQGGVLPEATENSVNPTSGTLQKKMSELQASCQLLVSQVASIQTLTAAPTNTETEVLERLSSQVSETCDNFLHILQECMDLSQRQPHTPVTPIKPLPLEQLYAPKKGGGLSPSTKPKGFSESELYLPKPHGKGTPTTEKATPTHMKSLPPHLLDSSEQLKQEISVSQSLPVVSHLESRANEQTANSLKPGMDPGGAAVADVNPSPVKQSVQVSKEARVGENDPGSDAESLLSLSSSADEGHVDSTLLEATSVPAESGTSASSNSKHSRSHSTSDYYVTPVSSPPPSPELSQPRERRIKDRIKVPDADEGRKHHTFFSSLSAKFEDMELEEGDLIPTQPFLHRCQLLLPFFDMLHSTAFAPVKADINGNITKLMKRYEEDPERYQTLQAMVDAELQNNSHTAKNSATDALLWLKRAMEFVCHFIGEVAGGEKSLDIAAGKAYGLSLRRHHNWIVRGIFNLAMKAVPYHKELLRLLGSLGTDEGERQVLLDMAVFSASLGELVTILNVYYQTHNLETQPTL